MAFQGGSQLYVRTYNGVTSEYHSGKKKKEANQIPETASLPMQWQGYIYIYRIE